MQRWSKLSFHPRNLSDEHHANNKHQTNISHLLKKWLITIKILILDVWWGTSAAAVVLTDTVLSLVGLNMLIGFSTGFWIEFPWRNTSENYSPKKNLLKQGRGVIHTAKSFPTFFTFLNDNFFPGIVSWGIIFRELSSEKKYPRKNPS